MSEENKKDDGRESASAGDIIRVLILVLQIAIQIINIWRDNKDAVTKEQIKEMLDSIERDRKVF